ncbi:hypothetical protein BDV98DRAFT_574850 [Pterulicium gracile]|uniref:Uncharacterized protein n=1 Tax=Pterulicium gracile TaxID=1884261 RepID=A0A5C3Q5A5_9AGAR|nr:hypothetical protein BDV98DRAFT_574850 [Pterula gracilis]
MIIPAGLLIDMLHARRCPDLTVKLASCKLTEAYSPYYQLSAKDLEERALQLARMKARDYWTPKSRLEVQSAGVGGMNPKSGSRPLAWGEGLSEREPEQKERLVRLQVGGLEVWM